MSAGSPVESGRTERFIDAQPLARSRGIGNRDRSDPRADIAEESTDVLTEDEGPEARDERDERDRQGVLNQRGTLLLSDEPPDHGSKSGHSQASHGCAIGNIPH